MFESSEVKRMLGVSDTTLWRYCAEKGLKFHKGKQGRRYFKYEDIMEFIRGEM